MSAGACMGSIRQVQPSPELRFINPSFEKFTTYKRIYTNDPRPSPDTSKEKTKCYVCNLLVYDSEINNHLLLHKKK